MTTTQSAILARQLPSGDIPSQIGDPGASDSITLAASDAPLTIITTQEVFIHSVTGATGYTTETTLVASTITDLDVYSSLSAAEAASKGAIRNTATHNSSKLIMNSGTSSSTKQDNTTTSASPTAGPRPDSDIPRSNAAAIAGIVIGGIAVIFFILIALFFIRRHRRRRSKNHIRLEAYEKPQLHSDDIQPHREELEGSRAPRHMLEHAIPRSKTTEIVELEGG
jgi:hypothetical protein